MNRSSDGEVSAETAEMFTIITREVLDRVKPDPSLENEISKVLSDLEAQIRTLSGQVGGEFSIQHVGSTAKGTNLNSGDIDLFLGFATSVPETVLRDTVFAVGKEVFFEFEIKYAEHPYVRGIFQGREVDLVPCYLVERGDQIMSAVDRTPFHTRYVASHLSDDRKDEVRLLKQFLKGIGCYGAENKTMGFSGYLCELLILQYGSFLGTLEAVGDWKENTIIDIESTGYSGPKQERSLLVVDPVDPRRNVASPVSLECIGTFVHASREFLTFPSLEFFFPHSPCILPEEIIEQEVALRGDLIFIGFPIPDVIDDILYPQLRMTLERLGTLLKEHGFELKDSGYIVLDRIYVYLEPKVTQLPPLTLHRGPTVYNGEHEARFLEKWRDRQPFLIGDRWFVLAPVKFRTLKELLTNKLPSLQTGRHIMASLGSGYDLLGSKDVPIEVLSRALDRRMPWQR